MPELDTLPETSGGHAGVAPEPARRAHLRRRRLAVVAVLTVLVAAWLAAPHVLLRLAPVSLSFPDDAPAAVVDGFAGPTGAYVVGYEHDAYLDVAVRVTDASLVGVEVVDVRPVLQDRPLLVPVGGWAPAADPPGPGVVGTWWVRFDNCESYHEREAMVLDRVEVEARVLGRTVVEEVALDRPVMARSPMLWQCPDRSIERGDDRRSGEAEVRRDAP